jgi:NhaP-type Na+/H+ or K+/H+ antiporter
VRGSDVLLIGAALIAYALVSGRLARTPLTAAIVFMTLGLVLGTEGLDVLRLEIRSEGMRLLVEMTLALLLFSDAARINSRRLVRESGFPIRLLTLALPMTIVMGTLVAWLMFPDLLVFEAAALAILLAPTDAALGEAVVTDRRLPSVVRQGLGVESGLNDGVCVPLLLSAIAAAKVEAAPGFDGEVLTELVRDLLVASAVGIAVGVTVGLLRAAVGHRQWVSAGWANTIPLVAAAVSYILADELGGSGFISCFVAGLCFGRFGGDHAREDTEFAEDLGQLLAAGTFFLFGAVMVGLAISGLEVTSVVYALLSLTAIRMIPVAISLIGSGASRPTVGLAGWFGPRGLATIVFALTIVEDADLAGTETIVEVATITVLLSVLAHGLSAPWLVGQYANWFGAHRDELTFEVSPAEVAPVDAPPDPVRADGAP